MKTSIPTKGATDTDRVWTLPNVITLLRLILLVPLCWLILTDRVDLTVLILLAVWAATDWVDGFAARLLNQRSRVGEVLDPIADRVGIALVLGCLALTGILHWGVLAAVVLTDVAVALFAGRAGLSGRLRVSWLGKLRTAALFVGILTLLAAVALAPSLAMAARWLVLGAVALHVVAGIQYAVSARSNGARL